MSSSFKKETKKSSSSILSELAPFVASVLRDGAVTNLWDELDDYRMHFNKVEVTGQKGKPIYAVGDLSEGKDGANANLWEVRLKAARSISLERLRDLQVQVGGIVLASFKGGHNIIDIYFDNPEFEFPYDDDDDNSDNNNTNSASSNARETLSYRMFSCNFGGSSAIWLDCLFGPLTREEYDNLNSIDSSEVLNVLVNNFQNHEPRKLLIFHAFSIDKPSIYDRLGMLEKQKGIHTNRDFNPQTEADHSDTDDENDADEARAADANEEDDGNDD